MLSSVAKEASVWILGGSIPEREDGEERLWNTATVWDPQGEPDRCPFASRAWSRESKKEARGKNENESRKHVADLPCFRFIPGNLVAKHRKIHMYDVDIPGGITFFESKSLAPGSQLTVFETRSSPFLPLSSHSSSRRSSLLCMPPRSLWNYRNCNLFRHPLPGHALVHDRPTPQHLRVPAAVCVQSRLGSGCGLSIEASFKKLRVRTDHSHVAINSGRSSNEFGQSASLPFDASRSSYADSTAAFRPPALRAMDNQIFVGMCSASRDDTADVRSSFRLPSVPDIPLSSPSHLHPLPPTSTSPTATPSSAPPTEPSSPPPRLTTNPNASSGRGSTRS